VPEFGEGTAGGVERRAVSRWSRRDCGHAVGTAEMYWDSITVQSSLTGRVSLGTIPALETPGYCHTSLRDVILSTTHLYFVENLKTVFDLNVSPGFRVVLGKSG